MPKRKEVNAWFREYDNPQKKVVQRIREILLEDPRIDECIKWKSPTFTYNGNLASFNPRSKQHASLLFHTGAKIPGKFKRLEGTDDTARTMKIKDLDDAEDAADELRAIVDAWCKMKDNG